MSAYVVLNRLGGGHVGIEVGAIRLFEEKMKFTGDRNQFHRTELVLYDGSKISVKETAEEVRKKVLEAQVQEYIS